MSAEKKLREGAIQDLNSDAPDPVTPIEPADNIETPVTDAESFSKNEDLKKEFGDFETFKAYHDAVEGGFVKSLKK